MSRPQKYDDIDFTPPDEVADNARRGLELREEFDRGGTQTGVARARDLKNRERLTPNTIERMVSYFARHQVDKNADNFGDERDPSAGYVAWLLWGGDTGCEWANSVKKQMEVADQEYHS
ncbi:MAG: hypothetical protein AAGD92_00310 [Pseudomonadota bacterium]